jgi:hypothetical protein
MQYKIGNMVKWAYSEEEWIVAKVLRREFLLLVSLSSEDMTIEVHHTEVKLLGACVAGYIKARFARLFH